MKDHHTFFGMDPKLRDLLTRYSGTATLSFSQIEHLKVQSRGWEGITLLHMVCLQGIVEDVEILINAGSSVNAVDDFGTTPLHFAIGCSDPANAQKIVRLLLAAGADPNVQTEWDTTPLAKARERGLHEIARDLLSAGATA